MARDPKRSADVAPGSSPSDQIIDELTDELIKMAAFEGGSFEVQQNRW